MRLCECGHSPCVSKRWATTEAERCRAFTGINEAITLLMALRTTNPRSFMLGIAHWSPPCLIKAPIFFCTSTCVSVCVNCCLCGRGRGRRCLCCVNDGVHGALVIWTYALCCCCESHSSRQMEAYMVQR